MRRSRLKSSFGVNRIRVAAEECCSHVSASPGCAETTAQQPASTASGGEAKQRRYALHPKYAARVWCSRALRSFSQDCAFCHGRDAGGGETGPDLTRSKLVTAMSMATRSAPSYATGAPTKVCPRLIARMSRSRASWPSFTRNRLMRLTKTGGRKGVDPVDLQTGNAEAGKQYFNGAGGCASVIRRPAILLESLASPRP